MPAQRRQSRRSPSHSTPRRSALERLINVADFERAAQRRLPRGAFDYFAGGAEDERTVERNVAGYGRYVFLPRVLVDVSRVDTANTVLGAKVSTPILCAPTAYQRLAHREGEIATARGAGAAGSLMCVSTMATCPLEDIAAESTGPLWFQLYLSPERARTERMIERAEQSGYKAFALTVDTPRLGRRERDLRTNFKLPPQLSLANFAEAGKPAERWQGLPGRARAANDLIDPRMTWETVAWLRTATRLPIVLKGVMRPDDAKRAVDAGVAGIWVSNHGGRQLDSEQATILALPAVVDAVAGRAEVYVDGGIRRGTDVLKALALGARAAFIGRPYVWGLAVGGDAGVRRVLDLLREELEVAMAVAGVADVANVPRDLLVSAS